MTAKEKPARDINELFKDIPVRHVMAFNSISALAYVGAAGAYVNPEDPSLQFILVAKDRETLVRIFEYLEVPFDAEKAKPVGVTSTTHLRLIPYEQASDHLMSRTYPDPMASERAAPAPAPADDDDW